MFICILCSEQRKKIVLDILNDCKGINGFFTVDNIESKLINLDNQLSLNDRDIGELLEKSF